MSPKPTPKPRTWGSIRKRKDRPCYVVRFSAERRTIESAGDATCREAACKLIRTARSRRDRLAMASLNPARASNWLPYRLADADRRRAGCSTASRFVASALGAPKGQKVDGDQYRIQWYAWARYSTTELYVAYGDLIVGSGSISAFAARLGWALEQLLGLGEARLHPRHDAMGATGPLHSGEEYGGVLIAAWQGASIESSSFGLRAPDQDARERYMRILDLLVRLGQRGVVRNHVLMLSAVLCLRHLSPPDSYPALQALADVAAAGLADDDRAVPHPEEGRIVKWIKRVYESTDQLRAASVDARGLDECLKHQRKAFRAMLGGPYTGMMCPAFDEFVEVDLWACGMHVVSRLFGGAPAPEVGPPAQLCSLEPVR